MTSLVSLLSAFQLLFLITLPSISLTASVNTTYMLDNPRFIYEPAGAWHLEGVAWTNVLNASVQMDFEGIAIYLKTLTKEDRGILKITIDDSESFQLVEYSPIEGEVWWGKQLRPGPHHFRAWNYYGRGEEDSLNLTHPYVAFEALVVTTDDPNAQDPDDLLWWIAFGCVVAGCFFLFVTYKALTAWLHRRWPTEDAQRLDLSWGYHEGDSGASTCNEALPSPVATSSSPTVTETTRFGTINPFLLAQSSQALSKDSMMWPGQSAQCFADPVQICKARVVQLRPHSKTEQTTFDYSSRSPIMPIASSYPPLSPDSNTTSLPPKQTLPHLISTIPPVYELHR